MKVGDLVKANGNDRLGIIVDVCPQGHMFVCWGDCTFLYSSHILEVISESR